MDGSFRNSPCSIIIYIIGLLFGLILIVMFAAMLVSDEFTTLDDLVISCFFLCFGFIVLVFSIGSLYVNHKAFIHIDNLTISAFCHHGFRLDCNIADIDSISYGGTGLTLRLKNGRRYGFMNLQNAYDIGAYIQRRLTLSVSLENKERLIAAIPSLRKKRRKSGFGALSCFLLMFPTVFLALILTGWKDLQNFNSHDWTIFLLMGCTEVILLTLFTVLLRKWTTSIENLTTKENRLNRIIIQTTATLPGNAKRMFISNDLYSVSRITVFGYPNSEQVYFTVETVTRDYTLECLHTSRIYDDFNEITPYIDGMEEVTLPHTF